jgi:hypothetical protein
LNLQLGLFGFFVPFWEVWGPFGVFALVENSKIFCFIMKILGTLAKTGGACHTEKK